MTFASKMNQEAEPAASSGLQSNAGFENAGLDINNSFEEAGEAPF
jgi:hypothetical protein